MEHVKDSNEYKKVIIENIVFLQGDDFTQYEQDSNVPNYMGDVLYLLQWYYPNEHSTDEYYARDINTPFLGRLIKITGFKGYFLFTKNTSIGYIGLSRIVEFKV